MTQDPDDAHPPRGGHPLQPIALDEHGVARFKANKIVRALLDWSSARGMSLNDLAALGFPAEDWEQFCQLIGYSVSGAGELTYFSDAAYEEAASKVDALLAPIETAQDILSKLVVGTCIRCGLPITEADSWTHDGPSMGGYPPTVPVYHTASQRSAISREALAHGATDSDHLVRPAFGTASRTPY